MKKFPFILTLCVLLITGFSAGAQEKLKRAPSVTLGYLPMTTYTMDLARRSGNIMFDYYKADINVSLGYERQRKGVITLMEFSYTKLNNRNFTDDRDTKPNAKGEIPRDLDAFHPENQESLQEFVFLAGAGITINRQRRIQFPIYFCAGPGYVLGQDIHNLTANLGLKARVKLYITDSIGLYGGYAGHAALGLKTEQDEGYKAETFSMINIAHGPEFGLIYSF